MVSITSGENSDKLWGGLRRGSEIGTARAKLFAKAATILKADDYEVGPFVNGPHSLKKLDGQSPRAPFQGWSQGTQATQVIEKWKQEGDPLGFIVGLLRQWKPHVAISMDAHCGVSGNPEHIAVARLLLQAISLASDSKVYPERGKPWQVDRVLFTAKVLPQLVACQYCKCEGLPPTIIPTSIPTLSPSKTHGLSYLGVKCVVARAYQNVMVGKGWTVRQIHNQCRQMQKKAMKAFQRGNQGEPFYEPFRIQQVAPRK